MSFFNAHGTNPNIFTGQFQDFDFGSAEESPLSGWVSVEELLTSPNSDLSHDDERHNPPPLDFDREDPELLYGEHEILAWVQGRYSDTIDQLDIYTKQAELAEPVDDDEFDDSFMPSFGGRNRTNDVIDWSEERCYTWPHRNHGRKLAKFGIDGKRGRKSSRNHRVGNRQEFAQLRDYWANDYDQWEDFFREENPPAIPEFGIETVGLTKSDASYYEAEYQRERDDYVRELEMMSWYDQTEHLSGLMLESVYISQSDFLKPISNSAVNIWERHLFPERFEDYSPSRFSLWDCYDDYGMGYDDYQDDRHLDYHLDLEPLDDDMHDLVLNLGPSDEDWAEIDRIAMERMYDEEADRFSPSFVGSRRARLRDRATEPRRGKLAKQNAARFFYRGGRPYMANAT